MAMDDEIMVNKLALINKIVEQILDFARSAEPRLEPVNLNDLIDDLGLLTRHKLQHQHVQLVRELAPNLPLIMADATQLEQAFLNLILNAVEAMPHGGRLTIRTRSLKAPAAGGGGLQVAIEFKDTGEGMSEDQRQRAFTSLLSTTKIRGTGLGLAIVGRVVEAHHGAIKIQSQPGRGTTIRIEFPV